MIEHKKQYNKMSDFIKYCSVEALSLLRIACEAQFSSTTQQSVVNCVEENKGNKDG